MTNKMKFAGKTPICVDCNKFYSGKKLTEEQRRVAEMTGLCPACQERLADKIPTEPIKVEVISNTVPNTEDATPDTAEVKAVSANKVIRNIVNSAVASGKLTDEVLRKLTDKQFTLKKLGGIKYTFFKEIDIEDDIKAQLMVNGRARYSKKLIEINGRSFAMTNDLYAKNIEAVAAAFENL